LSLFFWKVTLPYFVRFKCLLFVSLLIALLIGYINEIGRILSLSRTFTFFPFFLAGYSLREYSFAHLLKPKVRIPAALVLLLGLIGSFRWSSVHFGWLFGCYPYAVMGYQGWLSAWPRLMLYGITAILGFAFLSLIPQHKAFFTAMGSRSLYVYLFHFFVIKVVLVMGIYKKITSLQAELGLLALAVLCSLVLSSRLCKNLTKTFVEPQIIQ
jgi:fucose 4-O-acetylase-like acetyltransferase